MTESYSRLAHVALTYPIIDNHCHNLLTAASRDHLALERLTSENDGAQGDGLADARFTIAHMRAVRQLVQLYGCLPNWEAVKEARAALDYDELCRRCFEGQNIFALLIDNGLGDVAEHCEPVSRHAQWTTGGVARIVLRVESIAEVCIGNTTTATLVNSAHSKSRRSLETCSSSKDLNYPSYMTSSTDWTPFSPLAPKIPMSWPSNPLYAIEPVSILK